MSMFKKEKIKEKKTFTMRKEGATTIIIECISNKERNSIFSGLKYALKMLK